MKLFYVYFFCLNIAFSANSLVAMENLTQKQVSIGCFNNVIEETKKKFDSNDSTKKSQDELLKTEKNKIILNNLEKNPQIEIVPIESEKIIIESDDSSDDIGWDLESLE